MSLNSIFDIAGSALTAETTRLKTTASNLSNANVVAGSADGVYKAQYPVFHSVENNGKQWMNDALEAGVLVDGIVEDKRPAVPQFEPNNPMADKDGFVYATGINYVEEIANMISASRSYQMDVEMMSTAKQLMQRTLQLGE